MTDRKPRTYVNQRLVPLQDLGAQAPGPHPDNKGRTMAYINPDDQDHELVDHLLLYRQVREDVAEVMTSLRADFVALGHRVVDEVPRTPDRTVALRKLHDACQAAIAALALNQ